MKSLIYAEQFVTDDGWPGTEFPIELLNSLCTQFSKIYLITGSNPYFDSNPISSSLSPLIEVLRIPSFKSRNKFLSKSVNSIIFPLYSAFYLAKYNYTHIASQTNPPTIVLICALFSYIKRTRYILIAMDIYPEIVLQSSPAIYKPLIRTIGVLFSYAYRAADHIVSLSNSMSSLLLSKGIQNAKISVIPNWAFGHHNISTQQPKSQSSQYLQQKFGIPPNKLVILYSGNIGSAHDWLTIARTLVNIDSPLNLKFLFLSNGSNAKKLFNHLQIHNVNIDYCFHQPVENAYLEDLFQLTDLGFVTLRSNCSGIVMPSKFVSLLARGVPVLYIGPHNDISALINKHNLGFHIRNRDCSSLSSLFIRLSAGDVDLSALSRNCFTTYNMLFSRNKALDAYSKLFDQVSVST